MNKIINVSTLLLSSLFSATSFAHTGHGNNNVFHSHNGGDYYLVILIIGLLIGFASYYVYKKTYQNNLIFN